MLGAREAAEHRGGDILEFGTNGVGTVFASGLGNAVGIAIEIPEPSSMLLTALAIVSLSFAVRPRHRRDK
jgi:hypothetical protein